MRLLIYTFLLVLLFSNCRNEDLDGKMDPNQDGEYSCCEIPPKEFCAGGANLFMPNAFTPNGDYANDFFGPQLGDGFESVSMYITDMDGNNHFRSENIDLDLVSNTDISEGDAWGGHDIFGVKVDGLFRYRIEAINLSGESYSFEGVACSRPELTLPCEEFEKHCAYGAQNNGLGGFDKNFPSGEPNCE